VIGRSVTTADTPAVRATRIDSGRAATVHAIADATRRIKRHRGQILRALCGGVSWRDERVVRSLEELRRALADRAIARELLREFHQIDTAGGGE